MNQDQDFIPRAALEQITRTWGVVFAALLLGAAIGWLASFFLRPVYETRLGFTIGVDFALTGPLEEITLDQIKHAAGDTMFSPAVVESVAQRLQAEGIVLSPAELRALAFRESHLMIWQLRLRHSDPELLYRVATIWGEETYSALQTAYPHAVRVQALQQTLATLGACSPGSQIPTPQLPNSQLPTPQPVIIETCVLPEGTVVEDEIARVIAELAVEMPQTLGIYPGILFDYTNPPAYPEQPVMFQRAILVLAGAVIGLAAGAWLTSTPVGAQLARRLRRGTPAKDQEGHAP